MSFLTAEWRKLLMANYAVPPETLARYVPFGTELDLWEGKCYVSVVGFMFLNTALLGLKIPFHTNFPEVNLRFYVKRWDGQEWKRGVTFIKEIVPKPALTLVANAVYNENYETLPMQHDWDETSDQRTVSYRWKKGGRWHTIEATADKAPSPIIVGSETEFITEHYWGYAPVNDRSSNEYEVTHPKWEQYLVVSHKVDIDFGGVYGIDFAFLNQQKADSVLLAEGSEITVEGKRRVGEGN